MRGYFGIMTSTNISSELNGKGEKVSFDTSKNTLWQPQTITQIPPHGEPIWYLRVNVLKDQEGQGDCPSHRFAFKSMHHLTHASNQLDAAFGTTFDVRKCGLEKGDAMGGRVNDGRSGNVTIEFDSNASKDGWKSFLRKLKTLEDEWEHEGMSVL